MGLADYDWGFFWRSVATFAGLLLIIAGAATLAAALFFPGTGTAPDTPLGALPRWGQALAGLAVTLAGAAIAGVPMWLAVRDMWEVRKREEEMDEE